jgi:lactate dehydrogenase-like 2-hydroxyacid dehydrogenase
MGIVGYGTLGKTVEHLAHAFGLSPKGIDRIKEHLEQSYQFLFTDSPGRASSLPWATSETSPPTSTA